MSVGIALSEAEKRQARRVMSEQSMAKMKPPALMNSEANKAFNETRKELQADYEGTLLMLTTDVNRLLHALKDVCMRKGLNPGDEYDAACKAIVVPTEVERQLELRKAVEAEKAMKKGDKDIPGQQKIPGTAPGGKKNKHDDGSTAEAASEVKTSKVKEK